MNSVYSSGAVTPVVTPRPWTTMAGSVLAHGALFLVILFLGRAAGVLPDAAPQPLKYVRVVVPEAPRLTPPPVRLPPPPPKEIVKAETKVPVPEIEKAPVPERVVAREEPKPTPDPSPEPPVLDRPKQPAVVTVGAFDSGPASPQMVNPSKPVQQAGFDTSAARASDPKAASAIVGAFDQTAVGGRMRPGNGRPNGVADAGFGTGLGTVAGGGGKGVVAAGGFDSTTGGGGGGGARPAQTVKASDFDARAAQTEKPQVKPQAPTEVALQILSKPTPAYTDEARAMKIEGEVALEVEFMATGEVKVMRIVRGLGHGLDESAIRAVKGVRFKPAQRDGQPVDVRTTVNIVFQLA
jgi:TonB family protein